VIGNAYLALGALVVVALAGIPIVLRLPSHVSATRQRA